MKTTNVHLIDVDYSRVEELVFDPEGRHAASGSSCCQHLGRTSLRLDGEFS